MQNSKPTESFCKIQIPNIASEIQQVVKASLKAEAAAELQGPNERGNGLQMKIESGCAEELSEEKKQLLRNRKKSGSHSQISVSSEVRPSGSSGCRAKFCSVL